MKSGQQLLSVIPRRHGWRDNVDHDYRNGASASHIKQNISWIWVDDYGCILMCMIRGTTCELKSTIGVWSTRDAIMVSA